MEEGDTRRVKSLIDRPQLAAVRDRNGMTPLHKALLYGQTNTLRYLLSKYSQFVNCTDRVIFKIPILIIGWSHCFTLRSS